MTVQYINGGGYIETQGPSLLLADGAARLSCPRPYNNNAFYSAVRLQQRFIGIR